MSMLRRPLTQLTLCEEDIKWMSEEMAKKEKQVQKKLKKEGEEDEVESMDVTTSEKSFDKPSTPNVCLNAPHLRRQLEAVPTPVATSTPGGMAAIDMTTPINSEAMMPPAPNVRLTRAQARQRAIPPGIAAPHRNGLSSPVDFRFEALPETPEVDADTRRPTSSSSSSNSTSSAESPNAHLFATPQSSAQQPGDNGDSASGSSTSTRRSQR